MWLDTKRVEAAPTTVSRCAGILERFKTHLGKKADRDLTSLTALVDYLTELPATDSPDAPVFPKLSTKSASKLSEGWDVGFSG